MAKLGPISIPVTIELIKNHTITISEFMDDFDPKEDIDNTGRDRERLFELGYYEE